MQINKMYIEMNLFRKLTEKIVYDSIYTTI